MDSFCETAFLLCRHTCRELGIGLPDPLTMVEPIVRSAPALLQCASSDHSFVEKNVTRMHLAKSKCVSVILKGDEDDYFQKTYFD